MVADMASDVRGNRKFNYIHSCDLAVNFRIKIGTLEGKRDRPSYQALIDDPLLKYSGMYEEKCSDMYVTCQVFTDGKPLSLPVQTSYKPFTTRWNALRQGIHDLRLWPGVQADGSTQTSTPGKSFSSKERMNRLAKVPYTAEEDCQRHPVAEIVFIPDPEIALENLVESKHHKLVRSVRSGLSDKDLKPNAVTRDQLNVIVSYSPTKNLSSEEQDLVWKFRFYLTSQKKALTKFLKCVNWKVSGEAKQALELLGKWQAMDIDDALELLSPQFTHPAVRKYAVTRHPVDLLLYLLQLVQALKYENFDDIKSGLEQRRESSALNLNFTEMLSSTIPVEKESSHFDRSNTGHESQHQRTDSLLDHLREPPGLGIGEILLPADSPSTSSEMDLATFLISRACANDTLANYFYWYLLVECEDQDNTTKDPRVTDMYITVMKRFSQALIKGGRQYRLRRSLLSRQQNFIDKLVVLMKTVARESGNRKKKIERLQAMLSDPEANKINFTGFDPLPLSLDPEVKIKGIIPEKATLFKSALMPARLTFLTVDDTEYVAIFKHGDDLRQDQLILQTITLMDKLLRRENLDLKLTPYRVLATSSKHGFVQYIESTPVAEVLASEGSIQNYFRKHAPSELGPYNISTEVMDTYVKSCAGYCVITYLLGVGDRHLDNLLLTKTGKLFHIDFGYILGRDPKPLPPPMKLSKEMVEAMGGINSDHYQEFRKQCYTAFLHLRRHANLILNLFSLMMDASVPDIALEPDKTVKKVQDKFRLDLTDEEAVHYMQNMIDISVTAVMAALVEQIHKIAQYWRR
ncbi:phosphatidylinositol 3-kinase catalytic subunit type 3-like [Limulus polyphemus]|uniref:Phosphatidylinositol 3-kinase catalytic subunit type 3 n=1 Tax=Limulus polyphemus TaxID=6850 RepID=A0ABM1T8Y3_LIMPO|nr:phosphatidylinositol 3-kinase catalytic subunit type 3-like [Limulus polyphemus]